MALLFKQNVKEPPNNQTQQRNRQTSKNNQKGYNLQNFDVSGI